MVTIEAIIEQFEEFGIEATDSVLAKCIDLCITYNINDAVEFVEQWMAYSISNLEGAAPTIEYLADLERKELIPQQIKKSRDRAQQKVNATVLEPIEEPDDDFIDSYMLNTPKGPKKALPRTPATTQKSNAVLQFSPASYSPVPGTPRSSVAEGSGKPVYTFGKSNIIEKATWTTSRQNKLHIKQSLMHNNELLSTKSKYMFDSLLEKCMILGDRLYHTATELCKNHFGSDSTEYDVRNVDGVSQDKIKILGRVACEFDGKLDKNSVILVGTDEMKLRTTRLNFNNMKSYGVYPGQTIIASGVNPRGETFYVSEIFTDRLLKPPTKPELEESLTLVIAAGPFTHSEDLVYDPLHELIMYCKENKPDLLILSGPFIDAEHQLIATNALSETFDLCFEKMVTSLVEALGDTTICMVSSCKDAISHMVYPTPPNSLNKSFPNVKMMPDPSIIDVSGLKVGITSTDIVSHLLDEEISLNAGDKVKRVFNYMLNESSFYPLNPPSLEMCIDSDLASKFARLDNPPNILILPSKEKCFIRDINNCLTINPGYLSNSKSSGTFARIMINPSSDGARLADYVASQVVRI